MIARHHSLERHRIASRAVVAWCAVVLIGGASGFAAESAARRPAATAARPRTMVDHAVVPAGGAQCRQCGNGDFPLQQGHLAECRDGLCAPHCPVRPSQYGYYRTQWRRWPGQGVVPVSAEEAATPAAPPKSQVPTATEESPQTAADGSPPSDGDAPGGEPAADAETPRAEPARKRRMDDGLPTDPIPERGGPDAPVLPDEGARIGPEPAAAGRVAPVPPGEPPVPAESTEDEDLFDQPTPTKADDAPPVDAGAMRYPAQVGRSLTTGAAPWRLDTGVRQRPAGSARGL